MKISDHYRRRLEEAKALREKADEVRYTEPVDWNTVDRLRSEASSRESDADYFAHCIARFGDLPVATINFEALKSQVEHDTCCHCNPWYRGLSILEVESAPIPA